MVKTFLRKGITYLRVLILMARASATHVLALYARVRS